MHFDCARLNAVIRAVVARAVNGYGWRVFGLHQGTRGVLARPVDAMELELNSVSAAMLRLAGTILDATNRSAPFAFPLPEGVGRIVRVRSSKASACWVSTR